MNTSKTILITPLNWGLGHATRCIPLIRAFIRKNWRVVLASDGRALDLLKAEFPQLPCLELPPYNITYPSENMLWNMAWQAPKMMRAIRREHAAIEDIVRKYAPKVILSDNRFGCFSNATLNIFLTHQIHLQTPLPFFNPVANLFNHHFIKNFNQCWVPDFEGIPNLSGRLSHGKPPIPTRYIGPLSRMKFEKRLQKFEAIAVLSGPEPQRTFLEEQLIRQSEKTGMTMLLVQGKTEQRQTDIPYKNIRRVSFMTSEKLNEAILESGIVICRSG
ncbi:MAG: glycosyltransferase, partial [Bacteroidetes bacterium]